MSSSNTPKPSTPLRRRSTLADLGIKPNGATTTNTAASKSPTANVGNPTLRRAASTTMRPTKSPTVRPRPVSMVGPSGTKQHQPTASSSMVTGSNSSGTPAAIQTARAPRAASASTTTPKSSTTTAMKRRSVVPTVTPSTLRRSATVIGTSSPRNSVPPKGAATPSPSVSHTFLKEQVKELEKQLAEKERHVEELQNKLADHSGSEKSFDPVTPLLSSSSMLIPCDLSVGSEKEFMDKLKSEYQSEIEIVRKQLKEAQDEKDAATLQAKDQKTLEKEVWDQVSRELQAIHLQEKEQLIKEEAEKRNSELHQAKLVHDEKMGQLEHTLAELRNASESSASTNQTLLTRITELEKIVDESRNVSSLRRLEKQLAESQAALDDFKQQAKQATEALERRYRDEIKELQSGSDDTAEAWLEKHRAAQQEIDRFETQIVQLEQRHLETLALERIAHEAKIKEWKTKCEKQDNELDSQAQQISSLLGQVEDLQSSLEAATMRFEQRAALHRASDDGLAKNKDIHRRCEEKLQARQQEVDELHRRISELKETHEIQLNRFGQEKARELQELRNEMKAAQEMLQNSKGSGEASERLVSIAEQHRKEIQVLHNQSQKLVDLKERELSGYAYRVKTIMATKQKDMARAHKEFTEQIADYKERIQTFEQHMDEMLEKYAASQEENAHLTRRLQRLQQGGAP